MQLFQKVAERRAGIALSLGLAAAVAVGACSGEGPAAPSLSGEVSSTDVLYSAGNCNIAGATKDETAPFTLSGVDTIYVKAGRNCYGPFFAGADGVNVSDDACWSITWNGGTVTVASTGAPGCQGKGLSHIEGVVTKEPPPCEIDPKTGECKVEEPPK